MTQNAEQKEHRYYLPYIMGGKAVYLGHSFILFIFPFVIDRGIEIEMDSVNLKLEAILCKMSECNIKTHRNY